MNSCHLISTIHQDKFDEAISEFLQYLDNEGFELIDIKYSTCPEDTIQVRHSALIIYKLET